jgi:hypothetical protein
MSIWRPDRTFYPSPRMAELGRSHAEGTRISGRTQPSSTGWTSVLPVPCLNKPLNEFLIAQSFRYRR